MGNGRITTEKVYDLILDLHNKMDDRDEGIRKEISLVKEEVRGIKSFAGGVSFTISTIITLIGVFLGFRRDA